jgi:uncharacterized protein (DUF488 family)
VDIRRRRAVRGSAFAFANSQRLQDKLSALGVQYIHIVDLAPTNELIKLQSDADKKAKIKTRERSELDEQFKNIYKKEILEKYDLAHLLSELKRLNAQNVLFFCLEKDPCACHRSLVTAKIQAMYQIPIKHL